MRSLFLIFTQLAALAYSIDDRQYQRALQGCLQGRCGWGENTPGKMPPYDLGKGYICDAERFEKYQACMEKPASRESICLASANEHWLVCFENPCPALQTYCMRTRCKTSSNSWDCWRQLPNGNLQFGFETIDGNGLLSFVPIQGEEVPTELWKSHCDLMKSRCDTSNRLPKNQLNIPVSTDFCSAKCNGHNCHHAAFEKCLCLKKKGIPDIRIALLGNLSVKHPLPTGYGNLDHSILTIPHPQAIKRNEGYRCLLESEHTYNSKNVESCCYKTREELEQLSETSCSMATSGPLRLKTSFKSLYEVPNCERFLVNRDVGKSDTVPRLKLGTPRRTH